MRMPHLLFTLAALAAGAARADNCDEIQAQIEAKYRANGISRIALATVDVNATAPGRVVGSCAQGSRKIMAVLGEAGEGGGPAPLAPADAAAVRAPRPAPAAKRPRPILTECKDGTLIEDGECPK